jgi:hypothetical protein
MSFAAIKYPVTAVLAASLLAGCATQQGGGAGAADGGDPCSVGTSAAAGAAVGALLGAVINGKNGALAGAAIGAGVVGLGCYAFNVNSRQTKTAAQSDREYVKARGALPPEPQVVAYDSNVGTTVERGKPFKVNSTVELVNGRSEPIREVREQLVLLDTNGRPVKNGTKPVETTNASAGRYENSFELKLPEGVSQGVYPLQTNLYVNGKLAASRDLRTQVVINDDGAVLVATR